MKTDEIKQKMLHRIRATGRSEETFKTYWLWCERYIGFLKQRAEEFRSPEITSRDKAERWLSSLANGKEWVSKNTQNLALQSICYLYSCLYFIRSLKYTLLLQGLASWVSRFLFHMGKRAGQLNCCARSLTSVRQPARLTRLDWRSGLVKDTNYGTC